MKANIALTETDVVSNSLLTERQRREMRANLDRDIQAFLSRGGQVQHIDANVRADPPRKPNMNYGSAPI